MSEYHASILFHLLDVSLIALMLLFVSLGLVQALRQRRKDFLPWLVPLFIGDVVTLILDVLSSYRYFIWKPVPPLLGVVLNWAGLVPSSIFVYTTWRLWQTLRPKNMPGTLSRLSGPHPKEPPSCEGGV